MTRKTYEIKLVNEEILLIEADVRETFHQTYHFYYYPVDVDPQSGSAINLKICFYQVPIQNILYIKITDDQS